MSTTEYVVEVDHFPYIVRAEWTYQAIRIARKLYGKTNSKVRVIKDEKPATVHNFS